MTAGALISRLLECCKKQHTILHFRHIFFFLIVNGDPGTFWVAGEARFNVWTSEKRNGTTGNVFLLC